MLEIKNISKSFNGFKAVNNVSITVKKGTIHGLIGENGAGKTTIIKCITGIYNADKGEILLDGEPVYENPSVKARIGYVADSNSLFEDYRCKQMVGFFKDVYKTFDEEKFNTLNEIFGLDLNRSIMQLSKGQQMRLSFMLAISIKPDLLVLDEPTSGLDAIAKKQLLDVVIEEVEQRNLSVIISSHHLGELEKLCDEITIIQNGAVEYQSSIDDIKSQVKKLQVLFKSKPDINLLEANFGVEKIGSLYYLTTNDFTDSTIPNLKAMGATLVEEVGMSLEEIFILTAESR